MVKPGASLSFAPRKGQVVVHNPVALHRTHPGQLVKCQAVVCSSTQARRHPACEQLPLPLEVQGPQPAFHFTTMRTKGASLALQPKEQLPEYKT